MNEHNDTNHTNANNQTNKTKSSQHKESHGTRRHKNQTKATVGGRGMT